MNNHELTPYERIIDTVSRLFYQEGIHATGIDRIVKESRVAKMSLYKYFPSKDHLVIAYLQKRDVRWRAWLEEAVNRIGATPEDRILAIFDVLDEWFHSSDFHGCGFINAAAEFNDEQRSVHDIVNEHKQLVHDYVKQLAQAATLTDIDRVASQICLLMDGAIATALTRKNVNAAQTARQLASMLLIQYRQ
ncbi:TetR family transcriptional regulator [Ktedonobacter sp. SOSP1-85]|uniref:TetR/AcrR family transcriptional regulator n=1 Tax=Ktedonobacter sp. SOSP1-85 TaxID=2778367 RepID=UPI001915C495|nr:TetR/AcrR family transcriptional regulator [Ktedonobacter sp. SOSP1-85]GHO73829.1 TetR family transcriptional regulator [Ktedonobacter sp. SOSP1-85]